MQQGVEVSEPRMTLGSVVTSGYLPLLGRQALWSYQLSLGRSLIQLIRSGASSQRTIEESESCVRERSGG